MSNLTFGRKVKKNKTKKNKKKKKKKKTRRSINNLSSVEITLRVAKVNQSLPTVSTKFILQLGAFFSFLRYRLTFGILWAKSADGSFLLFPRN